MNIWDLDPSVHVMTDSPGFFQCLIGLAPSFPDHVDLTIAHGMEMEMLVTCSDGSHDPTQGTGSHGWILANDDRTVLLQGAGPVDGHPNLTSAYRPELSGLVAILYVLYRICLYHDIANGKVH